VLQLQERPAVALINIEGNKVIKEEDLLNGLKQSGLQEGDVFRRSALDQISQDLLRVYTSQGRYGADIRTEVEPLSGNRVQLNINIREGQVASIQHINIVGNTVFSDEELKDLFSLKLPNFWSFYKKDDRYAGPGFHHPGQETCLYQHRHYRRRAVFRARCERRR